MITLQFSEFGPPSETLACVDTPAPDDRGPDRGQLRLRIRYSPIHPSDLNLIEGVYGVRPELPAIPGGEASAVVAAVGPGVDDFAVGDPVVLRTRVGCWRDCLDIAAADCFRLPSDSDLAQASMLAINPATALRLLGDFVDLEAGDWVVQNAANSAVGRAVIQLASQRGLRTLNLVRREPLIAELSAIGATEVWLDENDPKFGERVRDLTGGSPPRLALNAVGGDSALRLMNALADGGTHVTYGAMGRRPLKVPNGLLIFRDLRLRGFWLTEWQQRASRDATDATFAELADHMSAGRLHQPVAQVFSPEACAEALAAAARDQRTGKILFEFNADR